MRLSSQTRARDALRPWCRCLGRAQANEMAVADDRQSRIRDKGLAAAPGVEGQLEEWMDRMGEKTAAIQQQLQLSNMTGQWLGIVRTSSYLLPFIHL